LSQNHSRRHHHRNRLSCSSSSLIEFQISSQLLNTLLDHFINVFNSPLKDTIVEGDDQFMNEEELSWHTCVWQSVIKMPYSRLFTRHHYCFA
jgi:hypothetical protein